MELLGPAPGDLANFGERFGAAAFESMRGAEFAGERQSAGKPIDGDDRIAACDPATTPRMESVSSVSAAQGPKVRRLSAGGRRIRTCMGLFLSSSCFWFMASFLFGAGKPFFIPSPAIWFCGARGRGQGTEMLASLAACRLAALVFRSAL